MEPIPILIMQEKPGFQAEMETVARVIVSTRIEILKMQLIVGDRAVLLIITKHSLKSMFRLRTVHVTLTRHLKARTKGGDKDRLGMTSINQGSSRQISIGALLT